MSDRNNENLNENGGAHPDPGSDTVTGTTGDPSTAERSGEIKKLKSGSNPFVVEQHHVGACPLGKCDGNDGIVGRTAAGVTLGECSNEDCMRGTYVLEGEAERRALEMEPVPGPDTGRVSQAADLVGIAMALGVHLFSTPTGEAFASVRNGGFESLAIDSNKFRLYLSQKYFEARRRPVASKAIDEAVSMLEAYALYDGPTSAVHVRSGADGDDIIIDLCDGTGAVVRVSAGGWEVERTSPVYFRRPGGMGALPMPTRSERPGGGLALLPKHVRMRPGDLVLALSFLVQSLRPTGPYPLLVVIGEQGTGKSTTSRILRSLTDPFIPAIRAAPKSEDDLVIAADNAHVLTFDNLTRLTVDLSDAFCRMSTGGGFAKRKLYTGRDEEVFNVQRPVILNGIEALATRPDLGDRALQVELLPIKPADRKTEAEIWAAFEEDRPAIFGGLLDALVAALRDEGGVVIAEKPRMADFARSSHAASRVFPAGLPTFEKAYAANRADAVLDALQSNPTGEAIIAMMEDPNREKYLKRMRGTSPFSPKANDALLPGQNVWEGVMLQLMEDVRLYLPEPGRVPQDFPRTAQRMAAELKRLAPALREFGIEREDLPRSDKKGSRRFRLTMKR